MREYFVSLRRAPRTSLLAGPFASREEAEAHVDAAVRMANDADQWSWFDDFGVMSMEPRGLVGVFNRALGLCQQSG